MGVDHDAIVVFGVSYTFSELQNAFSQIHPSQYGYEDGYEDGYILCAFEKWEIIGVNFGFVEYFVYSDPYYDADKEDQRFYIGIELKKNNYQNEYGYGISGVTKISDFKEILEKEQQVRKIIRDFSEKFNIENKENEIGIVFAPHIW